MGEVGVAIGILDGTQRQVDSGEILQYGKIRQFPHYTMSAFTWYSLTLLQLANKTRYHMDINLHESTCLNELQGTEEASNCKTWVTKLLILLHIIVMLPANIVAKQVMACTIFQVTFT